MEENTKIDANGVVYITKTKTRQIEDFEVVQASTTIIDKGQSEDRHHKTKSNCQDREEFESVWAEKWVPAEGEQHLARHIFPEPTLNK